jgi:hypothetical protein
MAPSTTITLLAIGLLTLSNTVTSMTATAELQNNENTQAQSHINVSRILLGYLNTDWSLDPFL